MIAITNRIFLLFFSALFLLAAGAYAYWQEEYLLLIPFGSLAAIVLMQRPEYLLYVLLLTIPWSIQLNVTAELGLNFPDEPLMLVAAFAGLILALHYHGRPQAAVLRHPVLMLLALQWIWTLVTVACSTNLLLSTKYLLAKSWYLAAFVLLPVFLFASEKLIKRAAVILLLSMLAFMFFALARHSQNNWSFAKINYALIPFYVNHVDYSALLVFMVPLQLAILRFTPHRQLKFILGFTTLITAGALYFSYARGAWLALVAGLLGYWLIRKRKLFLAYLVFILLCIGAVAWLSTKDRYLKFSNDYQSTIFHTNFREHLVATYQLKDVSTAERFHRWVAGVRMVRDSWKTGLGPTTFYQQYKNYTVPSFRTWVSRNEEQSTVHNYFLLMIVEQGVIGLAFFVVLLGSLFWYVQKIYHRTQSRFWKIVMAATAVILIMECTVNFLSDMIETDKVGSIFYLCIALTAVADLKTRNESNPSPHIEGIA